MWKEYLRHLDSKVDLVKFKVEVEVETEQAKTYS